jgi:hypothetical protein
MTGVSSWGCLGLKASVNQGLLITVHEDSLAVILLPTMDACG